MPLLLHVSFGVDDRLLRMQWWRYPPTSTIPSGRPPKMLELSQVLMYCVSSTNQLLLPSPMDWTRRWGFCSILGCVLPVQEVALCRSRPTLFVLCCPRLCHSLLPHGVICPTIFWICNWSYAFHLPFCASDCLEITVPVGWVLNTSNSLTNCASDVRSVAMHLLDVPSLFQQMGLLWA